MTKRWSGCPGRGAASLHFSPDAAQRWSLNGDRCTSHEWTKIRAGVRSRFAPTLSKRLDIHQARYRRTLEEVGRVWFTVDGEEVASFDTTSYGQKRAEIGDAIRKANNLRPYGETESEYRAADDTARSILRQAGEQDDYHAVEELQAFLSLPIEAALDSDSPILRVLAVVDARVGKRRLRELAEKPEHPFVKRLLDLRLEAENLSSQRPLSNEEL